MKVNLVNYKGQVILDLVAFLLNYCRTGTINTHSDGYSTFPAAFLIFAQILVTDFGCMADAVCNPECIPHKGKSSGTHFDRTRSILLFPPQNQQAKDAHEKRQCLNKRHIVDESKYVG